MMPALCTATVSLSALGHNLNIVRQCTAHSRIIAVIKANAYGHGMEAAAGALQAADAFAVARIEEGIALRAITHKNILVLSGVSGADGIRQCLMHQLLPVIQTQADWQLLKQQAPTLPYWLKADTGMHRLGLSADEFATIAAQRDSLCQGLMSHLSDAEIPQKNTTAQQLQQFAALHRQWPELPCSLANSGGVLFHPDSHYQWVRPGIMLYGCNPGTEETVFTRQLQPVMQLHSRVLAVRDINNGERVGYNGRWQAQKPSRIATIAAGYADGYPRHAKDGTPVWINGKIYPLAGKVSMDLITVDVTNGDVAIGDQVELWGENLPANTVAQWADTISYALFTGVTQRVPRIYTGQ